MSNEELAVFAEDNRLAFRPGEVLRVAVLWALPRAPERLEARLFWFTRGKGTPDVNVVATEHIQADASAGEQKVQFTLPAEPYSFSGRLISLIWAVELVAFPEERSARLEFTMSPTGQELVLGQST